jgi:hypothetical protein
MPAEHRPPIACTLAPGEYRERLASIARLARDALRSWTRRGLAIELRYAPDASAQVKEMVSKERVCCAFLQFDIEERPTDVVVTIRAPEETRGALDVLFGQFLVEKSS